VVKVAAGGRPLPNSGLIQVFSQKTGRLEALLLDEGLLTEIRTAAAGALAAKVLAPKSIQKIGMVGTSVQARYQLSMIKHVTECRNVVVWGRNTAKVHTLCQELNLQGWDAQGVDQADKLLEDCDLVITTTCSKEPILGKESVTTRNSGLHITCIGADAPGKIELDPKLVAKADLLVADTRLQSIERGEFQKAVDSGLVKEDSIVPLGGFIGQKQLHRKSEGDNRLTIFDSSGVALQDCVISSMVVSKINHKVAAA
jgi:ornithine cyclodeaminase